MSAPKRKTNRHKPAKIVTFKTLNVRIPVTQFEELAAAAGRTNLTIANTARLSIERGLAILVEQLTNPPSATPTQPA